MVMPSLLLLVLLSAAGPADRGAVDFEPVAAASHQFVPAHDLDGTLVLRDAVEGNVEEDGEDEILLCRPCRATEDYRLPAHRADFPQAPFPLSKGTRRRSLRGPPAL
jgi:hypothetical protein